MRRGKRRLSPEEKALWDQVAARTKRIKPEIPQSQEPEQTAPQPKRKSRPIHVDPDPIQHFLVGSKSNPTPRHDLTPSVTEGLKSAPLVMDAKRHRKMVSGKLAPEARIDLHGMTLSEAHNELIAFVLGSHQMGRRLVLVITGKGKDRDDGGPIPTRIGVLRHQVPQWLRLQPLGSVVMQVTPAHLRHGGHGAYYVYLRRTG